MVRLREESIGAVNGAVSWSKREQARKCQKQMKLQRARSGLRVARERQST